jgi:hypothetical protein
MNFISAGSISLGTFKIKNSDEVCRVCALAAKLGIGIEVDTTSTGIPAYCISVRYRSIPVPKHSGTGLGPLIPVPDWFRHRHFCSFWYRTDWMPDSPKFRHLKKRYRLHVHTAGGRKGHTLHVHTASVGGGEKEPMHTKLQVVKSSKLIQLLMVSFLLYAIEKSYVNAGMSECWRKVSPASAFLPVVSCLSPASVFRHQDSVWYRWVTD